MLRLRREYHQKGQTVVLVVMVMIVALITGVTMSSRFIKNLRNISRIDDSSKARGVAEALVEHLLLLPSSTLSDYINNNNCNTDCQLTITDANGQALTATAQLSFTGNSSSEYELTINPNQTEEISLIGFTSGRNLSVCWNDANSIVGQYIYQQSSTYAATPFAYNAATTTHPENQFSTASANYGFFSCFTVTAAQTPVALRLKSVYGKIDVSVVPSAGYSIPVQGIKIVSTGTATDVSKTVTVIKSTSFTPSDFDYALYQKSLSEPLSN